MPHDPRWASWFDAERARINAIGRRIRELRRLRKAHGKGRSRKRKGVATIRLGDGSVRVAEIHWYEAHGLGRKEVKIERLLG